MSRRVVIACLLPLVIACGAPRSTAPAAPTPASQPPAPRSRNAAPPNVFLGPSAVRYVVRQRHHIEQDMGMGMQGQDMAFSVFVSATIVGPADSAGYPATLTIDSIIPDSAAPPPAVINLASARGLRYRAHLTRVGELRNPVASDTAIAQSLGQLIGGFRNFFPRLPATGAAPGAEWSDTTSTTDPSSVSTLTVQTQAHHLAAPWETTGGERRLPIDIAATFTISGAGNAGGQSFTLAGTGRQSMRSYLAADGRFLGGESTDTTDLTITLTAQGIVVPRHQISHAIIAVLR